MVQNSVRKRSKSAMLVLLFVSCGMFHLTAGSAFCEEGGGVFETHKNSDETIDLPDLDEVVIGFKLKEISTTSINITISGPTKNNTQNVIYKRRKERLFMRISETEYEIPLGILINLKAANISPAGRKFTVSSNETVCWRMFLPSSCVTVPACESIPSTSEQPTSPAPENCPNTTTTICETLPSTRNEDMKTIILISVVCALLGLSFALICYIHHLRKRVQNGEKENRTIRSTNQEPDARASNTVTGTVSASALGYRYSAHDSENSLYGAVITNS